MNTPTHALIGMAAFGSRARPARAVAAALGGIAPDIAAIVMVLWASRIDGRSSSEIFRVLYFSEAWQALLAPWHSIPLWGLALAISAVSRSSLAVAFTASGLLHQAFDFPLHHDDPHRHLWPLSDWRFASPISYWNPAHGGDVVEPLETGLTVVLLALLVRRHHERSLRAALLLIGAAYLGQKVAFALMF